MRNNQRLYFIYWCSYFSDTYFAQQWQLFWKITFSIFSKNSLILNFTAYEFILKADSIVTTHIINWLIKFLDFQFLCFDYYLTQAVHWLSRYNQNTKLFLLVILDKTKFRQGLYVRFSEDVFYGFRRLDCCHLNKI